MVRRVSIGKAEATNLEALLPDSRQTGNYHDSDNQRGAALDEDSFFPIRTS
jgi:hypothetical protein